MTRKYILCVMLGVLSTVAVYSQNATLSGYITDAKTGEALIGATIYETGSGIGTATNRYGFYSLPVQEANVQIVFSFIGYQADTVGFVFSKDTVLNRRLKPEIQSLREVQVTGKTSQRETPLGLVNIPIARLKSIPVLMGEPDIIKALSLTPGVSIGNEGTSNMLVRGGTPDQNLILLDEATVYNVSHLFGLVSVFNPDAIKNVDLYKAGFPARFGGRLSSVLDITMKEGNNQEKKGEWSIGLLSSRFNLEGPLSNKLKGRTSYMVSARAFYLGIFTLPSYIAYRARKGDYFATYWMYDLNFKVNHKFKDGGQAFLSFYNGTDFYRAGDASSNQRSTFGLAWGNTTATARYVRSFTPKLFFKSALTYTRYRYGINLENFAVVDNREVRDNFLYSTPSIRDWTLKTSMDWFPNANHQVKAGFEGILHQYRPSNIETAFEINPDTLRKINTPVPATEMAVFVEDDVRIAPWLKANVGFRGVVFNVRDATYFSPEPRLTFNVLLPNDFAIKGAYSQVRQFIHLLINNGIGLPNDIWVPATRQVPPQFSRQVALGITKTLTRQNLELSVEAYHKTMTNLIDYKEGVNYLTNFRPWEETVEKNGIGEAYGLELFVNRTQGRFTGWLAYTLAWNTRRFAAINNGNQYPAPFDRRHNIALTGAYRLSSKVSVSANWIFQSGSPVTVPVAVRQDFERGFPVFIYGERNNFRMPAYHRLDMAFTFKHTTRKGKQATWALGVYNLYNRINPFYVDVQRRLIWQNQTNFSGPITGSDNWLRMGGFLPVLPYFSYSKKFR